MTLITFNNQRRPAFIPSMENMFNNFFGSEISKDFAVHMPSVNISESDNSYSIEAKAPGFDKNDFKIEVEEGILTVSGEHKQENTSEEKNFVHKEFNFGSFTRRFKLTDSVDEDKIDAKYENGILKIELPKKVAAEQTKSVKQIQIN